MASADLTRNIGRNDRPIMGVPGTAPMASKHDGAASYSNITTISESPVVPGVIWVGTNDGNLQVSRDSGNTWRNVADRVSEVPAETHVSRVEASHFDAATAYVTFDAHRTDDQKPYVFKTTDFGETWVSVAGNLPEGNVNVIREDPKNRDLLYLGTEYALFVSLDGGREWKRFMNGLPTVRIDDILVHPRDNDLIVATHGRSIYIMDDISALQQMPSTTATADDVVFDVRPAVAWTTDIQRAVLAEGAKLFRAQNPARGSAISYWLKAEPETDVRITITDITGREIRTIVGHEARGVEPRAVGPAAVACRPAGWRSRTWRRRRRRTRSGKRGGPGHLPRKSDDGRQNDWSEDRCRRGGHDVHAMRVTPRAVLRTPA